MLLFFFFQAEDGIRDGRVTGVQTCALPISMFSIFFTASSEFQPLSKCTSNGLSPHSRALKARYVLSTPPLMPNIQLYFLFCPFVFIAESKCLSFCFPSFP